MKSRWCSTRRLTRTICSSANSISSAPRTSSWSSSSSLPHSSSLSKLQLCLPVPRHRRRSDSSRQQLHSSLHRLPLTSARWICSPVLMPPTHHRHRLSTLSFHLRWPHSREDNQLRLRLVPWLILRQQWQPRRHRVRFNRHSSSSRHSVTCLALFRACSRIVIRQYHHLVAFSCQREQSVHSVAIPALSIINSSRKQQHRHPSSKHPLLALKIRLQLRRSNNSNTCWCSKNRPSHLAWASTSMPLLLRMALSTLTATHSTDYPPCWLMSPRLRLLARISKQHPQIRTRSFPLPLLLRPTWWQCRRSSEFQGATKITTKARRRPLLSP